MRKSLAWDQRSGAAEPSPRTKLTVGSRSGEGGVELETLVPPVELTHEPVEAIPPPPPAMSPAGKPRPRPKAKPRAKSKSKLKPRREGGRGA